MNTAPSAETPGLARAARPAGLPVLTTIERAGDARVAHIVLNRPQARNAITVALARGLYDALRAAGARAQVIVIRGAGGHFCAGGDFHEVSRLRAQGPAALRPLFEAFLAACELIGELPVPVIAAVEGYAMAGGFELIQACDLAVSRDDAVLADNHLNFGMIPGGGGSQRLPRIVGSQRALGLILSGDRLTGAQAEQWGLIYRSVPAAGFERAVAELAANLAGKDPAALASAKRLVRDGLRLPLRDGQALETETIIAHLSGGQAGAGISRFTDRERPAVQETEESS
ncbi:MAG: enoyl-CoA hydratase/isomerase family protein [Actinomycetota bacterium]|nr:enoyl-CoA hydratase/isomerase family protein [Actinomycetota bacterium]